MTQISASLVKELRERTGAGMMDCKRALEDANGDLEVATRLLREKGMASAAKRAGRATTEGRVLQRVVDDGARGTLVAVGCETEPVSKNEDFLAFVERALVIEPGNGAYLDTLGWAYYKQNRLEQAEPPLREAAKQLPTVSVIQEHLGDVLNKRGLYQEAIDAWQRAIDGDGDEVSRSALDDKVKAARQRLGRQK